MMQAAQAVRYRIVVEGVIDPVWHESLGGLAIAEQRQPGRPVVTQLEGRLVDQSAFQGVIATLFMLGLPLLFVERLPTNTTPTSTILGAETQSCEDTEQHKKAKGIQERNQ